MFLGATKEDSAQKQSMIQCCLMLAFLGKYQLDNLGLDKKLL
jgi:type VI protein secretion system component VasF